MNISNSLHIDFEQGINAAMDPSNAQSIRGGRAITTMDSQWLHLKCVECQHTFRLGDEVHISTENKVYHHSVLLPCSGHGEIAKVNQQQISEFLNGIYITWLSSDNLPLYQLKEKHFLLAPAYAGFQRYTCAVCGHTFRLHDLVVICPCKPEAPMCRIAIHRDPIHGLYCWDEWNPGEHLLYCPATSRKLEPNG